MFTIDEERGLILDEMGFPVSEATIKQILGGCKAHLKWTRDERELLVRRMLDTMGSMRDQVNIEAYL
jgi:hypothetical protein